MLALCGCQHPESTEGVVRPSSASQYPNFVGRRVELEGVVTQTKCPQILGVDLWELEEYRGRKMRVSGILKQSVVTQAQIEDTERRMGGRFANRGPGIFYHLEDLKYEPQP
jgi:hypothetical protein